MQYTNDGMLSTCASVFCGGIFRRNKRRVADRCDVHRNALFYAADGNGQIRGGAFSDCRGNQAGRMGE